MPGMSEPPDRRDEPGERRILERPPSARYVEPDRARTVGSPARGVAAAVGVALAGALVILLLAGVLAVSLGILVVAIAIGRFVGLALLAAEGLDRRTRRVLAALVAVDAVVLGYLLTWAYGRLEGGALGPLDYLAQTFGPLVPIQVALAALTAWWTSR